MFSFGYNYFVFFLSPEIIVMICFFFFFFFAIMSDKGKLGTYLHDLSVQTRSKLYKQLLVRQKIVQELISLFDTWGSKAKQFASTSRQASDSFLVCLQSVVRVADINQKQMKVLYTLQALETRTQYLSLQIKLYLTQDLFLNTTTPFLLKNKEVQILSLN